VQSQLEVEVTNGKGIKETVTLELDDLIDVKGWKALGNKLSPHKVDKVKLIEKEPTPEPEEPALAETSESGEESFDVGSTIDLDPKKNDAGQTELF
jgi:topoisomerase-4 subunit A